MALTPDQFDHYQEHGYVIIDCPFLEPLTKACLAAVEKYAVEPGAVGETRFGNHARLMPVDPESYWSAVDHSLPFMQLMLHPEFLEIAAQLDESDDSYFRNGGINDMGEKLAVHWHRDTLDGRDDRHEFMHYFTGGSKVHGCLRVVPGSHRDPVDELVDTLHRLREEQGLPMYPPTFATFEDVVLPGEVSLEVTPDQIILRRGSIYHATHMNNAGHSRMMNHWGFRPPDTDDHRFTWDDYLTDDLVAALTREQRKALWLGRDFKVSSQFDAERMRELGKVSWGVI